MLFADLLDHIQRSSGLDHGLAARVVADVLAYFSETTESFVKRRHRELQRESLTNPAIFERIARELSERRVGAPSLSERQLRRVVYG